MQMQVSLWENESFFARRDVIIIGGGIAGLWCAYELLSQSPSLRLLIVDKGLIPAGASTRNAGFACFGSPTELLHDAASFGNDSMLRTAEMRYKGILKMRNVLGDSGISFDPCGGYECLSHSLTDIDALSEQLASLNHNLRYITGDENDVCICY